MYQHRPAQTFGPQVHKGQPSTSKKIFLLLQIYQCGCGVVCSIKPSFSAASWRLSPSCWSSPLSQALLSSLVPPCDARVHNLKSPRLEVVPRLVLWLCGCEVVFQEGLDVFEGRPLVWVLLPALPHHLVEGLGAPLGAGHAVASFYLLEHLSVHHTWKETQRSAVWMDGSFICKDLQFDERQGLEILYMTHFLSLHFM